MLFEHTDQAMPETLEDPLTWVIKPLREFDLGLCHFLITRGNLTKTNTSLPHLPSWILYLLWIASFPRPLSFLLPFLYSSTSHLWANEPAVVWLSYRSLLSHSSEQLQRQPHTAPQLGVCTATHRCPPQSLVPLPLAYHCPDAFPKAVDATWTWKSRFQHSMYWMALLSMSTQADRRVLHTQSPSVGSSRWGKTIRHSYSASYKPSVSVCTSDVKYVFCRTAYV